MTSPGFRIRPFRPADLAAVLAVERPSFRGDAYPGSLFLDYYRRGALFLVAEAAGAVAGYSLAWTGAGRAELVSIAVAPSHRRAGAGKALLEGTLRRLRRRGAGRVSLMVKTTNEAAQRFYDSFGFRRVRRVRGYYEDGSDGFLMLREAAFTGTGAASRTLYRQKPR